MPLPPYLPPKKIAEGHRHHCQKFFFYARTVEGNPEIFGTEPHSPLAKVHSSIKNTISAVKTQLLSDKKIYSWNIMIENLKLFVRNEAKQSLQSCFAEMLSSKKMVRNS